MIPGRDLPSITWGVIALLLGVASVGVAVLQWAAMQDPALQPIQLIPWWIFVVGYVVSTGLILLSFWYSKEEGDSVYDFSGYKTGFDTHAMPLGASIPGYFIIRIWDARIREREYAARMIRRQAECPD